MLKAGAFADRVFCRYSELSVNTCENRLIKRALLFAERIVGRMLDQRQRSAVMLQGRLNGCLAAFAEVDDRVELWEVRRSKRNKLYRNVTTRAWLTGYYIVEYEQHGADRAKYGVMRKARRCLAFLYSVGEDAVEVMTWYDSSAAA